MLIRLWAISCFGHKVFTWWVQNVNFDRTIEICHLAHERCSTIQRTLYLMGPISFNEIGPNFVIAKLKWTIENNILIQEVLG